MLGAAGFSNAFTANQNNVWGATSPKPCFGKPLRPARFTQAKSKWLLSWHCDPLPSRSLGGAAEMPSGPLRRPGLTRPGSSRRPPGPSPGQHSSSESGLPCQDTSFIHARQKKSKHSEFRWSSESSPSLPLSLSLSPPPSILKPPSPFDQPGCGPLPGGPAWQALSRRPLWPPNLKIPSSGSESGAAQTAGPLVRVATRIIRPARIAEPATPAAADAALQPAEAQPAGPCAGGLRPGRVQRLRPPPSTPSPKCTICTVGRHAAGRCCYPRLQAHRRARGLDPEPASAPGVLEIRFEFKPGVLEKRFESKPGVLEVRSEFELSHEFEPASAPGRGPRLGFEFCWGR